MNISNLNTYQNVNNTTDNKNKPVNPDSPSQQPQINVYKDDSINISVKNPQKPVVIQKLELPEAHLIKSYSGKEAIFPSDWHSSKIKAKATVADKDLLDAAKESLNKAFEKYPSDVIPKEVNNIYLVGKLNCFGADYTGTNSKESVYVATNNNSEIEKTFHHELSSILLRNNPEKFDNYEWNSLSHGMATSSAGAINHGMNSVELNPQLYDKGFLTNYSLSNPENDFNMYAENLFAGGKEFWNIVDNNPKVKEKAELVINFYNKINPVFDETYFRLLAK